MSFIRVSDNYHHDYGCDIDECLRHYCNEHRFLWRDCETVKRGWEGDRDVIGGTHVVLELGDCPHCEADSKRKKLYRELVSRYWDDSVCPDCFKMTRCADDIAIHLVDLHSWDSEVARLWLRDEIERKVGKR